jgi:hypothetical protein
MGDRVEITRKYMEAVRDRKFEDIEPLLADNVVVTIPMTPAVSGKAAVIQGLRNAPAMPGAEAISWSDPVEEGDTVKSVGTGSPFGPIKVVAHFDAADKIDKIDVGLGA